jgi:hypothetical protein
MTKEKDVAGFSENKKEALKRSTSTLLTIYYVVVGLAITEALQKTFVKNGDFLGREVLSLDHLPKTFLLLALLPTVCRFVHGASLHLGVPTDKRYKPLVDFIGFFLQGSMFYLMALSLKTQSHFSFFFGFMLLLDTIWLIILRLFRYLKFGHTEKQWLISNISIIVILIGINLIEKNIGTVMGAFLIFTVAFAATVWDYVWNREFYFPQSKSLRTDQHVRHSCC